MSDIIDFVINYKHPIKQISNNLVVNFIPELELNEEDWQTLQKYFSKNKIDYSVIGNLEELRINGYMWEVKTRFLLKWKKD